jgi:hypothetical protein
MYLEGGVLATKPAHVPGRDSGGYKASPCTWKGEWWLQGQPMYLEGCDDAAVKILAVSGWRARALRHNEVTEPFHCSLALQRI